MLNTTVILFFGGLLAAGLLALYVLELIWPTRPRRRRAAQDVLEPDLPGRDPGMDAAANDEAPAASPASVPAEPALPRVDTEDLLASDAVRADLLGLEVPRSAPSTLDARADPTREPGEGSDEGPEIAGAEEDGHVYVIDLDAALETAATADERGPAALHIETLLAARRFDEALAAASRALEEAADPGARAALFALVAEARGALNDHAGAAEAFHAALDSAPDEDRERYRLRYVAFAAETVRGLIARSRATPGDAERVAVLGRARTLLGVADRQPMRDQALDEAVAQVNAVYWPAYESAVRALIRQHDLAEARRRVMDAVEDPALPESHRHAFDALQAEAVAAHIEQLATVAVRAFAEGREREAVSSLKLAEAMTADAGPWFTADHRREAGGRLCVAYTRIGVRRLDAGDASGALEPLFRALRYASGDAARQAEAAQAISRAVSSIAAERARVIRETASATPASMAGQIDKLWRLVQRALDAGVPEAMLEHAMALVRALERDFR